MRRHRSGWAESNKRLTDDGESSAGEEWRVTSSWCHLTLELSVIGQLHRLDDQMMLTKTHAAVHAVCWKPGNIATESCQDTSKLEKLDFALTTEQSRSMCTTASGIQTVTFITTLIMRQQWLLRGRPTGRIKPISQLRYDYDTTTTKNWHVHFLLASNHVEWK